MAQDGCLEVAWKGRAFPYLLHHPGGLQTENYGTARQAAGGHSHASAHQPSAESTKPKAGTGTWDGPAPKGYLKPGEAPSSSATVVVPEPRTIRLPSGTIMPIVGVSTLGVDNADIIREAVDIGYRNFDCAAVYGNEAVVGDGLKNTLSAGKRSELFISSKVWQTAHRPELLRNSCQSSIQKLGCEYLDLYLLHWPEAWHPESDPNPQGQPVPDNEVTLRDSWQAMESLVDAGLVKDIGVCNCSLKQIEDLLSWARIKPVVLQVELTPLLSQRKLVGVCYRKGVQCVAYAPFGGHGEGAEKLLKHPGIVAMAKEVGKPVHQVLLKWSLQRGVPALLEPVSAQHLKETWEGLFDWRFTNPQKCTMDALESGHRFVDMAWKTWADPEEGGITKPSLVL